MKTKYKTLIFLPLQSVILKLCKNLVDIHTLIQRENLAALWVRLRTASLLRVGVTPASADLICFCATASEL